MHRSGTAAGYAAPMTPPSRPAPPVDAMALWELGMATVQQAAQRLANDIAFQVPHMLHPEDPRFAILESQVRLPDGQVVKLQVTAEVVE
jgi:hypothetical protein